MQQCILYGSQAYCFLLHHKLGSQSTNFSSTKTIKPIQKKNLIFTNIQGNIKGIESNNMIFKQYSAYIRTHLYIIIHKLSDYTSNI